MTAAAADTMHPVLRGILDGHILPDGSPRHAESDGWYWLAGALGGAGERDHGGNGSPPATRLQCLERFAGLMRISMDEARQVARTAVAIERLQVLVDHAGTVVGDGGGVTTMRDWFSGWVARQRPRWELEAYLLAKASAR